MKKSLKKTDEKIECPGCGLMLNNQNIGFSNRYNATGECYQKYSDLSSYTLGKPDASFIHQHVVDVYAAQHAGSNMKNITTVFSLIGLYYAIVHGFNGKQVQRVHALLSHRKYNWGELHPPDNTAYSLNVFDVMKEQPGENRDEMIRKWMNDVWECWSHQHVWIKDICSELLK